MEWMIYNAGDVDDIPLEERIIEGDT